METSLSQEYKDRSEDNKIEEETTLRSKTEMSKDRFGLVFNDQSVDVKDAWKCHFCDVMNDDKRMKCEVCEAMKTKHGGTSQTNNNVKLNMKEREVKNYFGSTEDVTKESLDKDNNEVPDDVNYSVSTTKDFPLRNKSNIDSDLEDEVDLSKLNQSEVSHNEGHIQEEEKSYDKEFRGVFVDRDYRHEENKLELNNDKREVYSDKIRYTTNITLTEDSLSGETLTNILTVSNNDITVLDRWTCGKCTMLNVYKDELCKACGECGPHRDKWRCGQCTMINDKLKKKCQACNKINPFIKRCDHCHISNINYRYNKMCEECDSKIYTEKFNGQRITAQTIPHNTNVNGTTMFDIDPNEAPIEKWSCSKCSFMNEYNSHKCAVCDNDGPLRYKWRCKKCTVFNPRWRLWCSLCGFIKYFVLQKITSIFCNEPLKVSEKDFYDISAKFNKFDTENIIFQNHKIYKNKLFVSQCSLNECTKVNDSEYRLCDIGLRHRHIRSNRVRFNSF